MPFGEEGVQDGVGLALSGGGFRATLFHLGGLWRLNELGWLSRLDRVSSVSGGSITAGILAVRWPRLAWSGGSATNFEREVVKPLRDFCRRDIDTRAVGEGALLPGKRASDVVEEAYRDHLLGSGDLQSLPERPRFVINATHCGTGVGFRFSRPYAGDYRIGLLDHPTFRVSLAVAASSAFPPVLSPVVVEPPDPGAFTRTPGADLWEREDLRRRLVLTDGGVYDNLGLETVWNRYRTLLVSDAGAPFDPLERPGTGWVDQARRAMDIATTQGLSLRRRALVDDYRRGRRKGCYWGIDTDIAAYNLPDPLPSPAAVTSRLARMRTRLNEFSDGEQDRLINWGYAVCDAAMRAYGAPGSPPPPGWPCPAHPLDA